MRMRMRIHDRRQPLRASGLAKAIAEATDDVMFAKDLSATQAGLGIGPWLVRRLVEMHLGSIAAESAGLGRGSTFTVRLPLLRR